MARAQTSLLLALVLGLCVGRSAGRMTFHSTMAVATKMTTNPVRKVVTMLQDMQKKISDEGKKEKELFDKFMCYCQTGASDLEKSIEEANTKVPQLESDIQKMSEEKVQLEEDIKQAKKDEAAASQSLKEATALREKEAAEFAKLSDELNGELEALADAIAAEEKGMADSFLQSAAASTLRKFVRTADVSDSARETVSSFLSVEEDSDSPAAAEVIATLRQLEDTEKEKLAEATSQESDATKDHEALVAAKKKEISALTTAVQTKTARIGEVGTELTNMEDDLDDTKKGLTEDATFLKDMDKNCATKKQEWEARSKTRSEELLALADTIDILNKDEALDLFKKALPSTSLLQLPVSRKDVMRRTREALAAARQRDPRLNLISMATRGKKANFEKVFTMIDDMVALLVQEQADDDSKKDYCEKELDNAEAEEANLKRTKEQEETAVSEGKGEIETLEEDLASAEANIKGLDKKVAEGEVLRKQEHEEYEKEMAASAAAKKLLVMARDRMNQFYNPNATAPAFVQVARHMETTEDAPPPPPETFGAYTTKGEESTGVISMINLLIADLEKDMTEAKMEEKDSQGDYEKFVAEAAEKRATDTQALESKEAAKAEEEELLFKNKKEDKATLKQMMDTGKYIQGLHVQCDFLLQNFEARREGRGDEIDSLKKAKAVLSGADISLMQVSHSRLRRALRA